MTKLVKNTSQQSEPERNNARSPESRSRKRVKKGYVDYNGNFNKFTRKQLKKVVKLSDLNSKTRYSTSTVVSEEIGYNYAKIQHGTKNRGLNKAEKLARIQRAIDKAERDIIPLNFIYGYVSKSKRRKLRAL